MDKTDEKGTEAMTRELIDAIEQLEAQATAGPWWAQREYDGGRTVCQMRHQDELVCLNRAAHVEGNPWEAHWNNANLIQELRNNAKALLAAARRALELEEALEEAVIAWEAGSISEAGLIVAIFGIARGGM
jgi:hypothetical protein